MYTKAYRRLNYPEDQRHNLIVNGGFYLLNSLTSINRTLGIMAKNMTPGNVKGGRGATNCIEID